MLHVLNCAKTVVRALKQAITGRDESTEDSQQKRTYGVALSSIDEERQWHRGHGPSLWDELIDNEEYSPTLECLGHRFASAGLTPPEGELTDEMRRNIQDHLINHEKLQQRVDSTARYCLTAVTDGIQAADQAEQHSIETNEVTFQANGGDSPHITPDPEAYLMPEDSTTFVHEPLDEIIEGSEGGNTPKTSLSPDNKV